MVRTCKSFPLGLPVSGSIATEVQAIKDRCLRTVDASGGGRLSIKISDSICYEPPIDVVKQ